MIELSWSAAFLLYLLMAIGLLFGLWLRSHFHQKKKKITLSCQNIQVCEYCHNTFVSHRGDILFRCPSCHSLNKKT